MLFSLVGAEADQAAWTAHTLDALSAKTGASGSARVGRTMGYFRELFSEIHRGLTTPPSDPDFIDPKSVFAVVDVETTGLNPQSSRIVEIGVSRRNARFEEVDRWETLVRPDPCPRSISGKNIHGIGVRMLDAAPSFAGIHDELSEVLDGHILLAHNAEFDIDFLTAEAKRCYQAAGIATSGDYPFVGDAIDTISLAKQVLETGPYRLEELLARFGLDNPQAHRAVDDAGATGDLLQVLFGDKKQKVSKTLRDSKAFHRADEVAVLGVSGAVLPRL